MTSRFSLKHCIGSSFIFFYSCHISRCTPFHLSFISFSPSEGSCGGEFSTGPRSTTVIQSPNYPSNYLENIHCKWIITGPPNTQLRIVFTNFSTESTYDTVELCSGRFCEPSSRLATLTGQRSNSLYNSSSNVLSVELRTDGSTGRSGFRATVTAIEIQVPPTGMPAPHYSVLNDRCLCTWVEVSGTLYMSL